MWIERKGKLVAELRKKEKKKAAWVASGEKGKRSSFLIEINA